MSDTLLYCANLGALALGLMLMLGIRRDAAKAVDQSKPPRWVVDKLDENARSIMDNEREIARLRGALHQMRDSVK